jgi:hypothetical protein
VLNPSPHNTAVIVVEIAALVIGATAGVALSYEFDTHWYLAVLSGVAAYIVALVLVACPLATCRDLAQKRSRELTTRTTHEAAWVRKAGLPAVLGRHHRLCE